jgi:hypothetical protein
MRAFRQGLGETGFVEGRNVAIEFRFAELQNARLPAFAADLVRRQVAVIAGVDSTEGVRAAKAATATIPIVFNTGRLRPLAVTTATPYRPSANSCPATRRFSGKTENHLHLPANQIGQRGPRATILHWNQIDTGHHLEQLAENVCRAPSTSRRHVDLPRIGPCIGIGNRFG